MPCLWGWGFAMTDDTHTLIHIECDECGAVGTVTLLEHPRDAPQSESVADAHHLLAEEHADDTGHNTRVGNSEGTPDEIREMAMGLAEGIDGVDPAAFAAEATA